MISPEDWEEFFDDISDDEWDEAIEKLSEGPSASEEAETAKHELQKMGIIPPDEEE